LYNKLFCSQYSLLAVRSLWFCMRTAGRDFASTLHDARALVDFCCRGIVEMFKWNCRAAYRYGKPTVIQEREIQDAILTRMQIRCLDVIVLLFLRTQNWNNQFSMCKTQWHIDAITNYFYCGQKLTNKNFSQLFVKDRATGHLAMCIYCNVYIKIFLYNRQNS